MKEGRQAAAPSAGRELPACVGRGRPEGQARGFRYTPCRLQVLLQKLENPGYEHRPGHRKSTTAPCRHDCCGCVRRGHGAAQGSAGAAGRRSRPGTRAATQGPPGFRALLCCGHLGIFMDF